MKSKMPTGFWTAALRVGGLATVALFVLWSLYNKILDKVGLSRLGEENSFRFLVLLTALIFMAAIVAMVIWYLRNRDEGAVDLNSHFGGNRPEEAKSARANDQDETDVEFDIPPKWTFRQVSIALTQDAGSAVEFPGFDESELNAIIRSQKLQTKTIRVALGRLGSLAQSPIRPYRVTKREGLYQLKVGG